MKTMKRMAALVLCLSLLIGLPFAVQAVEIGGNMRLLSAFAMTNRLNIDWNYAEHTDKAIHNHVVALYMNDAPNGTDFMYKQNSVELYLEAYNAEGTIAVADADFYSFDVYPNTKGNVIAVGLGTRNSDGTFTKSEKGFAEYVADGATNFRLRVMNNRGENDNDGIVEGFATTDSYGWPLYGAKQWTNPAGKTDDTVSVEIQFATYATHPKGTADLTNLNNHLYIESVIQVSDSKYLVKFNKPIKVQNDDIAIELRSMNAVKLNNNGQPSNASDIADATTQTVNKTAVAQSIKVLGDKHWMEVTFDATEAASVLSYAELKNVFLYFGDSDSVKNSTASLYGTLGAQQLNGLIDGIWTESDINGDGIWNYDPLVKTNGRNRPDGADEVYEPIIKVTDDVEIIAWNDKGVYDDLSTAMAAGGTVYLGADVTVEGRFLEVPAGVTLDLNGKNLEVANIFSFVNIIDSTDGNGGLVISNDKTQAFVGLQESNTYFPLYDNDRYRFFSYDVTSAGTKAGTNSVKFGIKVNFNNLKAYELLQNDGALVLDLMVGEQNIPYKFNSATMTKLYNAVNADWTNRDRYAIALTISGLDNLASGTVITATPELTSAGVLGTDDAIEYTYTSAN